MSRTEHTIRRKNSERVTYNLISEIKVQCEYARRAYENVNKETRSIGTRNQGSFSELFSHLQNFLIAFANVSKILFPVSRTNKRGEIIRGYFNLPQGFIDILGNRTCRNHFEHFAERIETWAKETKKGTFIDQSLVDDKTEKEYDVDPGDLMRTCNPDKKVVGFRGEEFKLKEMWASLQALERKIENILSKMRHRWQDIMISLSRKIRFHSPLKPRESEKNKREANSTKDRSIRCNAHSFQSVDFPSPFHEAGVILEWGGKFFRFTRRYSLQVTQFMFPNTGRSNPT